MISFDPVYLILIVLFLCIGGWALVSQRSGFRRLATEYQTKYENAVYLARHGYVADNDTYTPYWHLPDPSASGRVKKWTLGEAVKRQRLIDEHKRLQVPIPEEHSYELGDFAND